MACEVWHRYNRLLLGHRTHLRAMFQEILFVFLLKYVYGLVTIFGLCPFRYDFEEKRFKRSRAIQLYSTFVVVSFTYFYPTSGISIVSSLNPLVAVTFFYLSMTTIFLTMTVQIFHSQELVRFSNDAIHFLYGFNKFIDRHKVNYLSSIFAIIFKIVVVNLTSQYACIDGVNTLLTQMTGKKNYFAIFMMSVAYTLQTMLPNIFYGSLLAVSFYLKQINEKIDEIIVKANRISSADENEYWKEKAFCDLSDRLDEIAIFHSRLIELTIRFNRLCSFQILLGIANFFGVLLIEVRTKRGKKQNKILNVSLFSALSILFTHCWGITNRSAHRQRFSNYCFDLFVGTIHRTVAVCSCLYWR